jgi:hypothetical protein
MGCQLAHLGTPRPRPRQLVRRCGTVTIPAAMSGDLSANRRRRSPQPGRDHTQRSAGCQTAGDLLPLSQAQPHRRASPGNGVGSRHIARDRPAHHPSSAPTPEPSAWPHALPATAPRSHPHQRPTTTDNHASSQPPQIRKCCADPLRPPADADVPGDPKSTLESGTRQERLAGRPTSARTNEVLGCHSTHSIDMRPREKLPST